MAREKTRKLEIDLLPKIRVEVYMILAFLTSAIVGGNDGIVCTGVRIAVKYPELAGAVEGKFFGLGSRAVPFSTCNR